MSAVRVTSPARAVPAARLGLVVTAGLIALPTPSVALVATTTIRQSSTAPPATSRPAEDVSWLNEGDGTLLRGTLVLPRAPDGPRPGVVVLSIAGTDRLVSRLENDGYVVLLPVRRGFVEVEPLLRATFADLGADIAAAVRYLRSRPEVDAGAIGVVAQGDDTPPALASAAASDDAVPMVLLAPPAYPGVGTFRREQRSLAERDGASAEELEALDRYVDGIADIVLTESGTFGRVYRLEALRAGSPVQLPNNAAFPSDERQARFFASALWRDILAFEPRGAYAQLRSPVLVLLGSEDPNTSAGDWLDSVEAGLSGSGSEDATACLIPGRTRHAFTDTGIATIAEWLGERLVSGAADGADRRAGETVSPARVPRPSTCLDSIPGS